MATAWGAATDTGGVRTVNEDAVLALPPVFLVADGMGGHEKGEMASAAVVEAFTDLAHDLLRRGAAEPARPDDVRRAVEHARELIRESVDRLDPAHARKVVAGTTVSGAILTEQAGTPYWLVFNIGDSRVYRLAGDDFEQVSVDHSVVQELVDAGAIDRSEADHHPQRNVITRAIGTGAAGEADFWMLPCGEHDRLMMCSDGLTGELRVPEIAAVLRAVPRPERAAADLLSRAVRGGAGDNVTVLVVDSGGAAWHAATSTAPRSDGADENEDTIPREPQKEVTVS
ncbi:protein serine/threonine phosphatase [Beutenbergia cavernae DSM 12333]|uniref:Protein serine/threonine phosphatase n=1 Tax=Beutenbergia cavernae (strain ATCC BAA-8 / DSM 12333 / CCUG 43141 / JCM 11478 / NBRC 16432 / NCIMB 13614 / HKI 0122) TaxID=471853 RepID=C5C498_BEUC1|nr:protein phosphatase 2C domain-containing protein [Beutenbergia cavernae]ACQ80011.1 protein serine/threonine phosphatase [Beutenbergia cavernae DSM 12333]